MHLCENPATCPIPVIVCSVVREENLATPSVLRSTCPSSYGPASSPRRSIRFSNNSQRTVAPRVRNLESRNVSMWGKMRVSKGAMISPGSNSKTF